MVLPIETVPLPLRHALVGILDDVVLHGQVADLEDRAGALHEVGDTEDGVGVGAGVGEPQPVGDGSSPSMVRPSMVTLLAVTMATAFAFPLLDERLGNASGVAGRASVRTGDLDGLVQCQIFLVRCGGNVNGAESAGGDARRRSG